MTNLELLEENRLLRAKLNVMHERLESMMYEHISIVQKLERSSRELQAFIEQGH